ncbi:bacterio-opsin activator domain-containing protein [Salinilacihabitans rarus]|uniref:helix-turn-helix domain-containing protein n=1 Tax=Salinilacihabitans rarus TaxID=2961596 RepID=UPI0020C8E976|nr:bacterio-opsin activator domain-containing protein [Salinilacihabitans rarus]
MTTIAEFELPAAETVLGTTFERAPAATCEMEQVIASDGYGLWFDGADRETVEAALDADETVREASLVSEGDDRWLFDVSFAADATDVFGLILSEGGTVLAASAADGRWHLRVRFVDREDASRLYDRLGEGRIGTNLVRLSELREQTPAACGLTAKQYETLLVALDHGYFTIPRETSMEELADELGVSHQALSERFRRAYRALVMTELNGTERSEPQTPDQPV